MGTHLSTNHQGRPILHNRQDGCPQVCRGASEEEAVGCHAVPPPCPLLGTPSIERHPPRQPPLAPRQGPPSRLQGQAGLRYLPRPRPSRWTQAPCPRGATDKRLASPCENERSIEFAAVGQGPVLGNKATMEGLRAVCAWVDYRLAARTAATMLFGVTWRRLGFVD